MGVRGQIHETYRIIDNPNYNALHVVQVPVHCILPLLPLYFFLDLTPACKGILIGYTPKPLILQLLKEWVCK